MLPETVPPEHGGNYSNSYINMHVNKKDCQYNYIYLHMCMLKFYMQFTFFRTLLY